MEEIFKAFLKFKRTRSTAGAILLDGKGHVFLVRGMGRDTWGFPKGGVEPPHQVGGATESLQECAIREVREETGIDVSSAIKKYPDRYIDVPKHVARRHTGPEEVGDGTERVDRLYIVRDWRMDAQHRGVAMSKYEITGSGWFHLSWLPRNWQDESQLYFLVGMGHKQRYSQAMAPFVHRLISWLQQRPDVA